MKFCFLIVGLVGVAMSWSAHAERLSYRLANPLGWTHLLPVGETPGWSGRLWFNFELSQASIWNRSFSMTDRRTSTIYTYAADFEQTTAIASFGMGLTDYLALAFEVPYANRNGGFLDDFIDQFHQVINTSRFGRNESPMFGNNFSMQENGSEILGSNKAEGVSGFKLKLKLWLLQWRSSTPGLCDCGFAISGQVKFPTQNWSRGLSSGRNDYSGLVHFGVPLGKESAFWGTAALTQTEQNPLFENWPMRRWMQMYEVSLDLGISGGWGLMLQGRYESPLMMKEHVYFNYQTSDTAEQAVERINSGWNSLMHWRGSQAIGPRYRWSVGHMANFLLIEDWGGGTYDSSGVFTYVNNAPDVMFISQLRFVF